MMVEIHSGHSLWENQQDFPINLQKYKDFANKNTSTVAQLLFGFYHFFGSQFDYINHVVSVRTASYLTKEEKKWKEKNFHWFCIEDPYSTHINLAWNLDLDCYRHVRGEFLRAERYCKITNIDQVWEAVSVVRY